MPETADTIDSRDAFTDELTDLIAAAEAEGVTVRGSYVVETPHTSSEYEVMVTPLDPHRA